MTEKVMNETVVEAPAAEKKEVIAELIVRMLEDGSIEVNIPEGGRELQAFEVESITRNVHEQLRDTRIAQHAVALFQAKLG